MGLSQEAHTHYFPQIDIVQKSEQCNVHAIFSQRSVHYPYKSVKKIIQPLSQSDRCD